MLVLGHREAELGARIGDGVLGHQAPDLALHRPGQRVPGGAQVGELGLPARLGDGALVQQRGLGRHMLERAVGVPELVAELELAQAFEELSKSHDAKTVARWLAGDLKKELNYRNLRLRDSKITQDQLHSLFALIESKKASDPAIKKVIRELAEKPRKIEGIVKELGLEAAASATELEGAVRAVMKENAKVVEDYRKGRKEALNFLVGAVMKKTKARAEPNKVREAMLRELA